MKKEIPSAMNDSVQEQPVTTTRRRFYDAVIVGTQAIIGAALAIPAIAYLLGPTKAHREGEWVEATDVSTLTPKIPVEVSFRKSRVDGWKVTNEKKTAWVVKMPDNSVVAYGPQCTHLGCAYHWDETKSEFICPCHNSFFAIDGKLISGPAPRPLDRYLTKIDGSKLLLGELRQAGDTKA
jgi:menaquinol-cytochrome c reductase iron-sulfur subunit